MRMTCKYKTTGSGTHKERLKKWKEKRDKDAKHIFHIG